MAIFVDSSGEPAHLDAHLHKLRSLVQHTEQLAAGGHPTPGELAYAPVIEGWALGLHPMHCLTGTFFGHPKIRSGNYGRTSDLWVLAPTLGYARTMSRLYRLGSKA